MHRLTWILLVVGLLVLVAAGVGLWWWRYHRNIQQELYNMVLDTLKKYNVCSNEADMRMAAHCASTQIIAKYGAAKVRDWLAYGLSTRDQDAVALLGLTCVGQYCQQSPVSPTL